MRRRRQDRKLIILLLLCKLKDGLILMFFHDQEHVVLLAYLHEWKEGLSVSGSKMVFCSVPGSIISVVL